MVPGILGKKIGMTQVFAEDGKRIPVTVLEAGPCVVQSVKTPETDGYSSVQLGFDDTKESRLKKPQRAFAKAKGIAPKKYVREIRCEGDSEVEVGAEVTVSQFQLGDYLDVTGTSKGKGFQGGIKRCGWSGGKETHGSKSHRRPGSVGCSASPAKIFKGHGMPGQMGNARNTVQNLEVVDVNTENNTLAVKGAVPGANGGYVEIRFALKKPLAERIVPEEPAEAEQENNEGNKE